MCGQGSDGDGRLFRRIHRMGGAVSSDETNTEGQQSKAVRTQTHTWIGPWLRLCRFVLVMATSAHVWLAARLVVVLVLRATRSSSGGLSGKEPCATRSAAR